MSEGHARMQVAEDSSLYLITAVSVLHLMWAVLLGIYASAGNSTPLSAVIAATGSRWAAVGALAGTAVVALAVSWLEHSSHHARVLPSLMMAGLLPQQFFLLISAGGGIAAAARGHYADGVSRAWAFILGDQLPIIVLALLYTTAIVVVARTSAEQ